MRLLGLVALGVSGCAGLSLGQAPLVLLKDGRPSGESVSASSLWSAGGAIVFAVRRPG